MLLTVGAVSSGCNAGDPAEARRAGESAPVAVRVALVEGRDEPVTLQATGSFHAAETSEVAPEASGRVAETPVDVGQFVRRGQPLVRVQAVSAKLRLDEARAAAARAEGNVKLAESQNQLAQVTADRQNALFKSGNISRMMADEAISRAESSRQSVVTANASLEEARAQLAQAEKGVGDVVVSAPFDGYISARHVSAGEFVQPTTPVVTLVKLDPLRLQLTIPGVQAGQIALGQKVTATVDAYPGQTFTGAITAITPVISPESRSFVVEAKVPNPKAVLKAGMFAVATIDRGETARTRLVPAEALIEDVNTDSWRVFVVDAENRAHLRVVQLAARQQTGSARVLAGVEEGERVAISNLAELHDSAMVTITQ